MSSPFITTVTDIAGIIYLYCKMAIKLSINIKSLVFILIFVNLWIFCLTLHFLMVLFTKHHSTFMSSETLSENKLVTIANLKLVTTLTWLDLT